MKILSFEVEGRRSFGRMDGDRVIDLGGPGKAPDIKTALALGALHTATEGEVIALSEVRLLPVVPNPSKILCVGHNYEAHRQETGRAQVNHPSIFTRFADTLVADDAPIVLPAVSTDLDYEGELAVIIGRGGHGISRDNAMSHVAGYACFNDASIRDWQWHTSQFIPGKNFPATAPFGPYMVTPDEAGDLSGVHVITRLNGEVMQDQPIRDMIFPIDQIIAYVSAFTPLSPGDVIATGTPGGVGAKRTPPVWMRSGDVVEVEIGPIGRLRNPIAAEADIGRA